MLIYATCCQRYHDLYAKAFVTSARAHGHEVEVFCDGGRAGTTDEALRYCLWRFQLLPELLRKHGSALMLDMDSVIRGPIKIEPEYDLGIFLRATIEPEFRTLCSIFYCTDRAMAFAEAMKDACDQAGKLKWCGEQALLWDVYERMGGDYRIKLLDRSIIDWELPSKAAIFTGKGRTKDNPDFRRELAKWNRRHDKLEAVTC